MIPPEELEQDLDSQSYPNFWAILPAHIRYNRKLDDFSKIMYSEICALSNLKGYSWSKNSHFEAKFYVSKAKVKRSLNLLVKCGYIIRGIDEKGCRTLMPDASTVAHMRTEGVHPRSGGGSPVSRGRLKSEPPYILIGKDNKKSEYVGQTLTSLKTVFKKPDVSEILAYCLERKNNVNAARFFDYYESNGWQVGKNKMKDWKAAVRNWERSYKQAVSGSKVVPYVIPKHEFKENSDEDLKKISDLIKDTIQKIGG